MAEKKKASADSDTTIVKQKPGKTLATVLPPSLITNLAQAATTVSHHLQYHYLRQEPLVSFMSLDAEKDAVPLYINEHVELLVINFKRLIEEYFCHQHRTPHNTVHLITRDYRLPFKFFIDDHYEMLNSRQDLEWEEGLSFLRTALDRVLSPFKTPQYHHDTTPLEDPTHAYGCIPNCIMAAYCNLYYHTQQLTQEQSLELKCQFDTFLYEEFLALFNPIKRQELGIWQTPDPVVSFIVNATDQIIQKHWGTEIGNDDVAVFDFAAGTGTFMKKVIDHVHSKGKLSPSFLFNNLSGCEYNRTTWRYGQNQLADHATKLLRTPISTEHIRLVNANTLLLDPSTVHTPYPQVDYTNPQVRKVTARTQKSHDPLVLRAQQEEKARLEAEAQKKQEDYEASFLFTPPPQQPKPTRKPSTPPEALTRLKPKLKDDTPSLF